MQGWHQPTAVRFATGGLLAAATATAGLTGKNDQVSLLAVALLGVALLGWSLSSQVCALMSEIINIRMERQVLESGQEIVRQGLAVSIDWAGGSGRALKIECTGKPTKPTLTLPDRNAGLLASN